MTRLFLVLILVASVSCGSTRTAADTTEDRRPTHTRVLRHDGQPLAQARVITLSRVLDGSDLSRDEIRSEYCDAAGFLTRPESSSTLLVDIDGELVPLIRYEIWNEDGRFESSLKTGGETVFVLLQVVNDRGRPLLATARVVSGPHDGIPIDRRMERGEPSGRLRHDRLWWPNSETIWLVVGARGMASRRVEVPLHRPGLDGEAEPTRLILERLRSAETLAVDDENGRPVLPRIVRVRLSPPVGDGALSEGSFRVEPDAAGRFTLPLGARRPFHIEVWAEGYEPWIDEEAGIETLEIRLKPTN